MAYEVNQLLFSPHEESPPRDEPFDHRENLEIDTRSPLEKYFNMKYISITYNFNLSVFTNLEF